MRYSAIIILFALISCAQPDYIPAGKKILSEEQMIPILIDFHLAEAGTQEGRIKKDSTVKHISTYYDHIYKLHEVSEEDFRKTFEFFVSNPYEFDALYEKINEQMKRGEAELKERNKAKSQNKRR